MSWHSEREAFKEEYYQKLKSPKWQKRRLEIMEKAGFKCQCCGDTEETLQIHHLIYLKGKDPWDYPNDHLECLCEICHELREEFNKWLGGRSLHSTGYCLGFRRIFTKCFLEKPFEPCENINLMLSQYRIWKGTEKPPCKIPIEYHI